MAVSLTIQNKRSLKKLLGTGRWNNESEVIRYGLHLVIEEVQAKERQQIAIEPISAEAMEKILREESAEEQAVRKAAGKASVRSSHQAIRKLKR